MPKDPTPRKSEDALAREVDRLLKKLPGADPTLKGEPEPDASRSAPRPGVVGVGTGSRPRVPEPSPRAQTVAVWLRALAAVAVGAAVSQWPYARECGWMLYLYLGVIAAVLVAGGWGTVWAWRVRVAGAHVLSLMVVFWGIVLAAEVILPRVGYAAERAAWQCRQ